MKKVISLLVVVLLVVTLCTVCLTGCNNGSSKDKISIGGTGPLTGGAAIYGIAVKNGATIAVEEINAMGDLQFEFKMEDDAHDAEKAVNAFRSLLDWGAQITLGSVTTAPSVATSALNKQYEIFALTPSASGTDVTKGKNNVFQMCFTDPNQGTASAEYIYNNLTTLAPNGKVAVIYKSDEDYSMGIRNTFKAAAQDKFSIVSETSFTGDNTDFQVQVADAKAKGAELIFLPMYYQPASLILAEAKKQEYNVKFFGVDGMDGILTMDGFNVELAEGVMLLTPFNADSKDSRTAAFVKKYQERFGEIPNQFAADAYDCVYAIYAACKKGGVKPTMSAKEINAILVSTFTSSDFTFSGITGDNMTWTTGGEVNKKPKGMVIENGAYKGLD